MQLWNKHPGVRSEGELTLGERAADKMRNGMGSWGFVFAALAFLAFWMFVLNRSGGFDPYPYILLNLCLSCLAALQGAILLIAAKRSDQISAELAEHDYNTDVEAKDIVKTLSIDFATMQAQHATMTEQQTVMQQQLADLHALLVGTKAGDK